VIDDVLKANERYAAARAEAQLPMPAGKKFALVTCMDARIEPRHAFGIAEGQAYVIRNAGGRVSEALRSLSICQLLLGAEEVAIIHHTDCGMTTFTDDQLREKIKAELGGDANSVAFLPFRDVEESVRDDLALYRESKIVRQDVPVRGFVFDVETGRLHEVSAE
jgi:carbonic anhydrase